MEELPPFLSSKRGASSASHANRNTLNYHCFWPRSLHFGSGSWTFQTNDHPPETATTTLPELYSLLQVALLESPRAVFKILITSDYNQEATNKYIEWDALPWAVSTILWPKSKSTQWRYWSMRHVMHTHTQVWIWICKTTLRIARLAEQYASNRINIWKCNIIIFHPPNQ